MNANNTNDTTATEASAEPKKVLNVDGLNNGQLLSMDENEEDTPPVLDRPAVFACPFCKSTGGTYFYPGQDWPRCVGCDAA